MVTDQQYLNLQKRVDELEKKLNALSVSFVEMKMLSRGQPSSQIVTSPATKRDKTRYLFNGIKYSKRSIVLAGIKQYIADHAVTSSAPLQQTFPTELQGSLGVIRPAAEAELYENATGRFFFGDDDVLTLTDGTFVVCKEWTAKNINNFIDIMNQLGYEITIINR